MQTRRPPCAFWPSQSVLSLAQARRSGRKGKGVGKGGGGPRKPVGSTQGAAKTKLNKSQPLWGALAGSQRALLTSSRAPSVARLEGQPGSAVARPTPAWHRKVLHEQRPLALPSTPGPNPLHLLLRQLGPSPAPRRTFKPRLRWPSRSGSGRGLAPSPAQASSSRRPKRNWKSFKRSCALKPIGSRIKSNRDKEDRLRTCSVELGQAVAERGEADKQQREQRLSSIRCGCNQFQTMRPKNRWPRLRPRRQKMRLRGRRLAQGGAFAPARRTDSGGCRNGEGRPRCDPG